MAGTAKRTDPALWERVKQEVTEGDKGGRAGQWSARKAQMAVQDYQRRGGGYAGAKRDDNHLHRWTAEDWGTASGVPAARPGSGICRGRRGRTGRRTSIVGRRRRSGGPMTAPRCAESSGTR